MASESRHVSVFIDRPVADVYRYAADPMNLPDWAAGLASGVSSEDGRTYADSPMGRIELRFAPPNEFGVLDHEVVASDGTTTYNPMRAVVADDGCEVIFSVRRRELSDEEFDRDASAVLADLQRLAAIMARR
jgi:hypothetical protein